MSDSEHNPDEKSVIRCRGLPWSATVEEIAEFFSDCELADGIDSINMVLTREGRPSGEAYIEMASEDDIEKALKKDRQNMGKRYVEVFRAKKSEMDWALKKSGNTVEDLNNGDNVVRLRGLPYEATKQDIVSFFDGLEITNNGILLTTDYQGRASGEAFVQFASKEHTERALAKNKMNLGHRYIEVFCSSMMEAQKSQMLGAGMRGGPRGGGAMMRGGGGRPGPYDRISGPPLGRGYGAHGPSGGRGSRSFKSFGGGSDDGYYGGGGGGGSGYSNFGPPPVGRFVVQMRGLPYRVTENDIAEWFSSVVDPVDISIRYNNQGRPTGEASVLFASDADARKAMSKDRQNMQHRYVELFYEGSSGRGGMGGSGPMGGASGYGRQQQQAPGGYGYNY